ncbi:hypothetical protein BC826DRAFT_1104665 [Russula brevipes]|nr:hypothetical protein BC826DRAFT_1104665 [Russula brevipes]
MRSTTFVTLFLALFAFLSSVALAAPVSSEGAVAKRQCYMGSCKFSTDDSSSGNTPSPDIRASIVDGIISALLGLKSSFGPQAPVAAAAGDPSPSPAESSSTTPATPAPTGASHSQSSSFTFRWFTEIAIPSGVPSGN